MFASNGQKSVSTLFDTGPNSTQRMRGPDRRTSPAQSDHKDIHYYMSIHTH